MQKTLTKKEFAENVRKYVKEALPEELSETRVCTTSLDLWANHPHMVLLIIRPWNSATTGFCLDRWYHGYLDKKETVETAAAAIINDRRLYCMLQEDGLNLKGGAVIYN